MTLTKLTVSGFGKLKGFSYTFNDELNTFIFENGWGKTTLSDFIYAMFYGLNSTTKKKLSENIRKKYQPWDGSVYGGSIDFTHNGKNYTIQRTFGSSAKDDTFILIDSDTNKECNDFSSEIGFEVFGIEKDSFERSIYVPQKDLETKFDESLKSKLANIIGGTNDVQNYESAITVLEKNKNEIKRKTVGKYFDKKAELEELERKILVTTNNVEMIPKLNESIDNIKNNINQLEKERENVFNEIKEFTDYQSYKQALGQLQVHEEELESIKENMSLKKKVLNGNTLEGINDCKIKIDQYEKLKIERDLLRKNISNQKEEEVISNDELTELENKISILDDVKKGISRIGFFIGVSIGILLIGLLVLVLVDVMLGGIVLGLGLISTVVFILLMSKSKNKKADLIDDISYILKKNELDIIGINESINYLKIKKNEQIKSLESKVKTNDLINNLEIKITDLQNEIESYLSKYNLNGYDFKLRVTELERTSIDIERLSRQIETKQDLISKFIKNNNLDVVREEVTGDYFSLKEKSNELNINIASLNQELNRTEISLISYEEEKVKLEDYLNEKDRLVEEINIMDKNYTIYEHTIKLLNEAQDSLLAKYVKPMKDNISKYLSLVSDKEFSIDTEFNFTYLEDGIRRDIDYYSKGIKQLIIVSMRLSLIDCLFPETKPFIIFDDSFVDFDEKNLNIMKKIIEIIKKEYQIIYFTCHDSRKM